RSSVLLWGEARDVALRMATGHHVYNGSKVSLCMRQYHPAWYGPGRDTRCMATFLTVRSKTMGPFSRQLSGLSVGLLCVMFGMLWLDMALQKAPWVINTQGQRFGWLSNWIWTEMQHPTFGLYKAFLEHVVWPNFTFFGYLAFFVEMALGVSLLLGVLTV